MAKRQLACCPPYYYGTKTTGPKVDGPGVVDISMKLA